MIIDRETERQTDRYNIEYRVRYAQLIMIYRLMGITTWTSASPCPKPSWQDRWNCRWSSTASPPSSRPRAGRAAVESRSP